MHPGIANERVGAAHEFVARFVAERGTGEYATKVRELVPAAKRSLPTPERSWTRKAWPR